MKLVEIPSDCIPMVERGLINAVRPHAVKYQVWPTFGNCTLKHEPLGLCVDFLFLLVQDGKTLYYETALPVRFTDRGIEGKMKLIVEPLT